MKNRWAFSLLWTNLAVAVALLIQGAGSQFSNWRELLHTAAYSLVYANIAAVLALLFAGWFAETQLLRKLRPVPVMAITIVLFTCLGCLLAQWLLIEIGAFPVTSFWPAYFRTLRTVLPLAIFFGSGAMVHALLLQRVQRMESELHRKELAEERMRKLAAEARLQSLESRIHPHFLFNTLNSISSLIAVNPSKAEQVVGRLAVLLRASLDIGSQSLIPLRNELEMVQSYFDIEKVRFGDKLRGTVEFPPELQDAKVPPLSVQSLVENAVKHGIAPQNGGGELLVKATAEGNCLRVEVMDSGPGFDLSSVRPGHGLDNLVGRLDTLFGPDARLNVFRRDGYSVAEMVLPRV